MCGIFGVISNSTGSIDRESFIRARDLMTHRGPDEAGVYQDDKTILGHRRLSIIDLGGGHQPMTLPEETVWIVFNGEIYNYRELRTELVKKGHSFRTSSDTEVILRLYMEEGKKGFKRLNGIFAICIWDKRTQECFLVRDHMGVKPLYYAETSKGLIFASEIKSILETGILEPELETEALPEYLIYRDVAGERTLFRGIRRLLPGHYLVLKGGKTISHRFWSVDEDRQRAFTGNFDDAVFRLDSLLSDAVRMQMVSDVPLGTFCSGGVDSSLITALATRHSSGTINTFSVGFDESEFDESKYARQVARHCGTAHHEVRLSNREFADQLETLIWHNDEPLHFPNSVHIHAVSQLARKYVTVVLTGEGADELFGGYPRYQIPVFVERWRKLPKPLKLLILKISRILGDHRVDKMNRFGKMQEGWDILLNSASTDSDRLRLSGTVLEQAVTPFRRMLHEKTLKNTESVTRLSLLDQQTYLVSILNRQDKMSMATSIESRVPFLDTRVVRFANSLPENYKQGRLDNKRIVKALALRYLPEQVIKRRKSGFGVPLATWFRSSDGLAEVLASTLNDDLVGEIFGKENLLNLFAEHQRGTSDHSDTLWAAMNLSLWSKVFNIAGDLKAAA